MHARDAAGPGHSSTGSTAGASATTGSATTRASGSAAFAWLRPRPAPTGWRLARIPSGAALAYPPSWRSVKTDPGTTSAALRTPSGRYLGYLNITPKQGTETLANWATFRVDHNHEEGDRSVTRLAYATGLRFLNGDGNCVKDAYVSGTGVHYVEIACLVAGAKASTVIVGAGPPSAWAQVSPTLERSISGFRT